MRPSLEKRLADDKRLFSRLAVILIFAAGLASGLALSLWQFEPFSLLAYGGVMLAFGYTLGVRIGLTTWLRKIF